MTEFRITRGGDILLYIGEEQLFGVTDFQAKSVYGSYPIREYLSGAPRAIVNAAYEYQIKMTVLSLFRFAVLEDDAFTLSVVDGDTTYLYEGCAVIRHDRSIKAGKSVVDEFVITAKSMRKQVQTNAG